MDKKLENIVRHSEVSEKEIEKYLRRQCAARGLLCLKYSNPCAVGYPDRLVVIPDGKVVWVELKSRGRRPSAIQAVRHEELRVIGHAVSVIDSREGVDRLLDRLDDLTL